MRIAILGTGMVGNAIATKLVQLRHQVVMGSRTANTMPGRDGFVPLAARRKSGRLRTLRRLAKLFSIAPTAQIRLRRCVSV
jgi:8-hydroxy-5-deazaflavin:NADPH oxidoreductase